MSYSRPIALGDFSWLQFWKKWYAVSIDGKKWYAPRYLSEYAASEWFLDSKEKNWNSVVTLFRQDGTLWRKASG